MKKTIYLVFILGLLLAACNGEEDGGAASATEDYIRALANKDKALTTNLSCQEWEESAILEIDGLLSVDASISNLACEVTGQEGESTLVNCSGSLDLAYNDEIRAIDLSRNTYYLQEIDGQWRVCQYK